MEKLDSYLRDLKNALSFMEQCSREHETATMTGAYRDAREWIQTAAENVVAAWETSNQKEENSNV